MKNKVYMSPAKRRGYRIFLYTLLGAGLCSICIMVYYSLWMRVPNQIRIYAGSTQSLEFQVPASGELYHSDQKEQQVAEADSRSVISEIENYTAVHVSLDKPITIMAGTNLDSYVMDLKLLGFIPFKEVNIQVIQDTYVIPAGIPIGIYVKTEGVLVIGTGEFSGPEGQVCSPCSNLLKPGDYILSVDGEAVESKAAFMTMVQEYGNSEMILTVKREEEVFDIKTTPELTKGNDYKLGIWIRDNAQGVGTLTYVDTEGCFGALGHGINDIDTSALMTVSGGSLYKTEIVGIRKGKNGSPGELTGVIDYSPRNQIGSIYTNTQEGIFGICSEELFQNIQGTPVQIGLKQEVRTGPAQIISSISGQPEYYDAEITEIHMENDGINRGIVLKITDPELLEITGGIVQGMSGSPILQDGKLVGAVTHVLVQDPSKGYGIFIERMLSEQ